MGFPSPFQNMVITYSIYFQNSPCFSKKISLTYQPLEKNKSDNLVNFIGDIT